MSNKLYKHIGDPFDCLAEECAEVIQILMKIKRFGIMNHHPDFEKEFNNAVRLEEEMRDVEDRIAEVRKLLPSVMEASMCHWELRGSDPSVLGSYVNSYYHTECGKGVTISDIPFNPICECGKRIQMI